MHFEVLKIALLWKFISMRTLSVRVSSSQGVSPQGFLFYISWASFLSTCSEHWCLLLYETAFWTIGNLFSEIFSKQLLSHWPIVSSLCVLSPCGFASEIMLIMSDDIQVISMLLHKQKIINVILMLSGIQNSAGD